MLHPILDRVRMAQAVHRHNCATKNCPNYYACHDRDCRTDWICPGCQDDEQADDLTRQEQEITRAENQ